MGELIALFENGVIPIPYLERRKKSIKSMTPIGN